MSQRKVSIKELDFNNMGAWPREYKIGFCVLIGVLIFRPSGLIGERVAERA